MALRTATVSSLQQALDTCVAAGAPGATIIISAPAVGFSFAGASGLFERGSSRRLKPEDPFRAASVSKAVTAATAVRLAAQGLWELDDSVASFLPAKVVRSLRRMKGLDSLEELTLRRLLSHRSGLPDYFFHERFQAQVQKEPERMWQPADLIEAAADVGKLDFTPGIDFAYGDTGYVLVGMAIEHLRTCSLADAYRSLIFSALDMDATYLEWHEPRRGAPVSHHYDGEHDLLPTNTSFDWGGGGLVTTAADLVKFLLGVFEAKLFSERWLAEMTSSGGRVHWRTDSSARYLHYGLGIGANLAAGEEILGATGVWGAFAYFWPAGGAAIAGTVNLRGADRSILLDAALSSMKAEMASS